MAESVDQEPGIWQAQYVAQLGPLVRTVTGILSDARFRTHRGNIPIGENVNTSAFPIIITAPYIEIDYTLPVVPFGTVGGGASVQQIVIADGESVLAPSEEPLTWSGRLKIFRRSREFSRDIDDVANGLATEILDITYPPSIDADLIRVHDPQFKVVDQDIGNPGFIWYYTIFYEQAGTGEWIIDPAFGFSRNFAYKQHVDGSGNPFSPMGKELFEYLPRRVRHEDVVNFNSTTKRTFQAIGRILDSLKEDIEQHREHGYDIDTVDFQILPYIDWLIGWPTNFELSEGNRRKETIQATALWQAKGTINSLELALQTVTGWNVNIFEGWKWVAHTSKEAPLDAAVVPPDWNPPTDGDWAALVGSVPAMTTVDSTDPKLAVFIGTPRDVNVYTPSTEDVSNAGVGWPWQNLNGLAVELTEVFDPTTGDLLSGILPAVIIHKIFRLAPLFAAHYATFAVILSTVDSEEFQPWGEDFWESLLTFELVETFPAWGFDLFRDFSDDLCLVHTYPHPDHPDDSTTWPFAAGYYQTPHATLEATCP